MQDEMRNQIEQILNEKVRPVLHEHSGEIQLLDFQDGILKVRMLGQCGSCPAATITNEEIIQKELCTAIPEIQSVSLVTGVSDSLIREARHLLSHSGRRTGR